MATKKLVVYIREELMKFFDDLVYSHFKNTGQIPIRIELTKKRNLMVIDMLEQIKTNAEKDLDLEVI